MWITQEEAKRLAALPTPPGYKTQSPDTSPAIERILFAAYARMPISEKARMFADLCDACEQLGRAGIRQRHPNATERDIRLRLASQRLDRETMIKLFDWDPLVMGY